MNIVKALSKPFTALAGKVDHSVEQKILMSLVRKGAMALGTYLMTKGYLDMSHVAEFAGALVALVAMFSGAKQKVDAEY